LQDFVVVSEYDGERERGAFCAAKPFSFLQYAARACGIETQGRKHSLFLVYLPR